MATIGLDKLYYAKITEDRTVMKLMAHLVNWQRQSLLT